MDVASDEVVVSKRCVHCGQPAMVRVKKRDQLRWIRGEYVQDVWPKMPAKQQEMLVSGTHPACWDAMFGSEED